MAAQAAPKIRDPEEEWIQTLNPTAARHARARMVPMEPGYDAARQYNARYVEIADHPHPRTGGLYSQELTERGTKCYYARRDYGECVFVCQDGGWAVLISGKQWFDPDSPKDIPALGGHPAGAEFHCSARNILIPKEEKKK